MNTSIGLASMCNSCLDRKPTFCILACVEPGRCLGRLKVKFLLMRTSKLLKTNCLLLRVEDAWHGSCRSGNSFMSFSSKALTGSSSRTPCKLPNLKHPLHDLQDPFHDSAANDARHKYLRKHAWHLGHPLKQGAVDLWSSASTRRPVRPLLRTVGGRRSFNETTSSKVTQKLTQHSRGKVHPDWSTLAAGGFDLLSGSCIIGA